MRGKIVKTFKGKDYCFLRGDTEAFNRFVHGGAVSVQSPVSLDGLEEGDIVTFEPEMEVIDGEEKQRAVTVCLIAKWGDIESGSHVTEEER